MAVLHHIITYEKSVRDTLEVLSPCSCTEYPPNLAPSSYHLLASMTSRTCRATFWFVRWREKCLDEWSTVKGGGIFTGMIFTNCPKDGKNEWRAMEHTLNKALFIDLLNLMFLKKKVCISCLYTWYSCHCFVLTKDGRRIMNVRTFCSREFLNNGKT